MEQQQQQAPLLITPKKRKEAAPWWDIFSPCKEAFSDSEDEDAMSDANHDPNNSIIDDDLTESTPQTAPSKTANGQQVEKDTHNNKSPLPKAEDESKTPKETGSQKGDEPVTRKLFGGDEKRAKQCSEEQNKVPSLVDETNTAESSGEKPTHDKDVATLKDKKADGNDNATTKDKADVSTKVGKKSGQMPSVPKQPLGPRQTVQEQCLSYIKLPVQIASILFSAWVGMIIIRIVMIMVVKFLGDNQLFEGFNAPGIY